MNKENKEIKPREWWVHINEKTGEIDRSFEIHKGYFSCCGLGGPYIHVRQVISK